MPSALKLLKKGQKKDSNPFELKFSKTKHAIFNKKVKGEKGKPGQTRKRGIQKRQETIGQELKSSKKSNAFVDKRFGEFSSMTMEDKLLSRNKLIAEKKFSSQNNLNFETDEIKLTHSGMDIDAFQDGGLEKVYDSDSGELPRELVQNVHFGGFSDENVKSKNEIYQEIIQKSKMAKMERRLAKEADEDLTREVDDELKDIRDLLNASAAPSLGDNVDLPPVRRFADGSFRTDEDYDRYVKELIYEKRAQATDRLKTEEEVAIEEKMKLEKLEMERLQKMNGLDISQDAKRVSQGDDLDNGLDFEQEKTVQEPLVYQDGKLLNNEIFFKSSKKRNREVEEGIEGDESDASLEMDSDGNDSDLGSDENDSADSIENDSNIGSTKSDNEMELSEDKGELESNDGENDIHTNSGIDSENSLPFTFQAPSSLDEFMELTNGRSDEEINTILHRIRVLYNRRLHADNKKKLETLLLILFEYLENIPHQEDYYTQKCNAVGKHIVQLSEEFVQITADYAINKINKLRETFAKLENVMMPRASELAFFKTLILIFPGSDMYHPIMTPLILLMAQYLEMAPVKNDQDLVCGLKICENLFFTQKLSKRYIPEVINFLTSTISCFSGNSKSISPCFLRVKLDGYNESLESENLGDLDLDTILSPKHELEPELDQRLSILEMSLKLLADFIRIYSDLPSWNEICEPLSSALNCITARNSTIKDQLSLVKGKLEASVSSAKLKRVPLELLKRKPIPLKTYTPQFQKNYSVDKKYNPNKEKAEFAKLKFQHKQEFKGAIRELKKDAEFIARAKAADRKEKDVEYKKKMDKIMGQLTSQEGAMRGYEREKKKVKRKL